MNIQKLLSPDHLSKVKRLAISFSGGRTSAIMTKLCLDHLPKMIDGIEIQVTFANTGCEHEGTLDFVNACDLYWSFNTVWLEAEIGPPGKGVRHKVVDYESASRDAETYSSAVKKYGVFNRTTPQCTSRLKIEPMESYLKSLGWIRGKNINYWTAIGIRADEIDRMSGKAEQEQIIYPLVESGVTKDMVNALRRKAPFDLDLPGEHYGNCVTCWKKSERKLLTIARENPHFFSWFDQMERESVTDGEPRYFFRGNRSSQDIKALAKRKRFKPFEETLQFSIWDEFLDKGETCDQGCEVIWGMEGCK